MTEADASGPGRLLIASNVFPPEIIGGAEIVAHRQAVAFAEQGWQVTVLAGSARRVHAPELTTERMDGLRVIRLALPYRGLAENFHQPAAERVAQSLLQAIRPHAVHLHNLPGLSAGLVPLARAAGARVVVTLHDTWGFCLRQTRLRDGGIVCDDLTECDLCLPSVPSHLAEPLPVRLRRDYVRWCLEHADDLVFPSESLREASCQGGVRGPQLHTLSNGLNLAAFPPRLRSPDQEVQFVSLSTLAPHKGAPVLWDALEELLRDNALQGRWRMVIGGDGPLAPALRARFEQGALRDPVCWRGFIPREAVPAQIARADVAVLASIWPENQPVFLMESMASGGAQIGTRIGGIPELIEDGESGLLVPPGDAGALAAAMRRLILEPSLVRRFSARNVARHASLDGALTVQRLVQLFTSAPVPESRHPQPVVLCWGAMQGAGSATTAAIRLRRFDDRVRLLWHEWAGLAPIGGADVLCIFGDQLPAGAIARAALAGMPIVAPRSWGVTKLPGVSDGIHWYQTEDEALEIAGRLARDAAMAGRLAARHQAAAGVGEELP